MHTHKHTAHQTTYIISEPVGGGGVENLLAVVLFKQLLVLNWSTWFLTPKKPGRLVVLVVPCPKSKTNTQHNKRNRKQNRCVNILHCCTNQYKNYFLFKQQTILHWNHLNEQHWNNLYNNSVHFCKHRQNDFQIGTILTSPVWA